jgi:hypothetical protein
MEITKVWIPPKGQPQCSAVVLKLYTKSSGLYINVKLILGDSQPSCAVDGHM